MKSCEECKRLKKQLKYARKETDRFARLYMKQREFAKKLDEQFIGVMITVCGDLKESNAGDDVESDAALTGGECRSVNGLVSET